MAAVAGTSAGAVLLRGRCTVCHSLDRVLVRELDTPETRRDVSVSLVNLARIAVARGNPSQATLHLKEARASAEAFGTLQPISDSEDMIAAIDQLLDHLPPSQRCGLATGGRSRLVICKVGRDPDIPLIDEGVDGLARLGEIADRLLLRRGGCSGCSLSGTCGTCMPLVRLYRKAKAPLENYCQHRKPREEVTTS